LSVFTEGLVERVLSLSPNGKALALVLLAVVLYGGMIAADYAGVRVWLDDSFGPTPDLPIYQERTSLILNGGIIYRDLDIESPPLINYMLLPPQIIGGERWAYEAYFSIFPMLTALGMYWVFRPYDDRLAFMSGALYLVCPYALQDATWGVQDEPLVCFFYLLPALIMVTGHPKWSAVALAVGFWTKFLPIVMLPALMATLRSWRKALVPIAVTIAASFLIILPFLLVAPIDFLGFPSYYLLRNEGEGSAGMSLIYTLSEGGFVIDGLIGGSFAILAVLASCVMSWKWRLDPWRASMLSTVMFLSIYPMIRLSYYMIPFAFFTLWAVRDRRMILEMALMYLALLFGQGFAIGPVFGLGGGATWAFAFALVLMGTLLMIDIMRRCLKAKCFLDDRPAAIEGAARQP